MLDVGTGVAPFLPVTPPEYTRVTLPLRIVTLVIKFPLILIFSLLFFIVDSILRLLVGSISKTFFETFRSSIARAHLFVCGFYTIPISYDQRHTRSPQAGDIILVNSASPMDIFIVAWLFPSALFTRFDNEMLFQTQSAVSAFFARFSFTRVRHGNAINELLRSAKSDGRVVIIFPEATTSNNRGLLAFCPMMIEEAFIFTIKYNNPPYLSTPTPGLQWNFWWSLASMWTHGCRLKGSSQKVELDFADTMAKLARVPKTNLGIEDKAEFLKSWNRR